MKNFLNLLIAAFLAAPLGAAAADVTTDKPGQFVRIELPKGGI
ncbi:MAG: hypothetical protein ACI8UO_001919, partial [Verrucomicrobiales bacterium]